MELVLTDVVVYPHYIWAEDSEITTTAGTPLYYHQDS